MRKAVLMEKRRLELQDAPAPECGPGDVLVAVRYAGVCRTDRKAYHMGQRDLSMPRVLGHEIAGVVLEAGPQVSGCRPGDKVHVHPGLFCGRCGPCREKQDQVCQDMEILGFHRDGGFQEICLVPAKGVAQNVLTVLPPEADLSDIALAEPLACAIHMLRRLNLKKNDLVLIIGGGVLGVLFAKLCRHQRKGNVIVLETSAFRRNLLKNLGFDCAAPGEYETYCADVAIPCCPGNNGFTLAASALKPRGRLGFFSGLTADNPPSRDVLNLLHYKELSLFGAYGCGLRDSREAVSLFLGGFSVSDLPRKILRLEDLPRVLANLDPRRGLLNIVKL